MTFVCHENEEKKYVPLSIICIIIHVKTCWRCSLWHKNLFVISPSFEIVYINENNWHSHKIQTINIKTIRNPFHSIGWICEQQLTNGSWMPSTALKWKKEKKKNKQNKTNHIYGTRTMDDGRWTMDDGEIVTANKMPLFDEQNQVLRCVNIFTNTKKK